MFDGLLKIAPRCDVCGADFDKADVGDGGLRLRDVHRRLSCVILYLLVEVAFSPPWWVHLIFQIPFIPIVSILLLRPIKGLLFALQFEHDAQEARLDD